MLTQVGAQNKAGILTCKHASDPPGGLSPNPCASESVDSELLNMCISNKRVGDAGYVGPRTTF